MDDTPDPRARSPKAEPTSGPTEAELSRIAREAVHQAPDSRLDKQLARMGLVDAEAPSEPHPVRPATGPTATDPELERLRIELRRSKAMVRTLAAVIAILAVAVVALLVRSWVLAA
jgi:hypothetical protein